MTTRVATFLFHDVTDDPATSGFQRPAAERYKHTRSQFWGQLDAIASESTVIGAVDVLAEETVPVVADHPSMITFDDGGASALEVARELRERDIVAHFFVTTGRMDDPTFLTPDAVREVHDLGHVVGSHSVTHPDIFRDLTSVEMAHEWDASLEVLSDLLGIGCRWASVPGGDISRQVLDVASRRGIRFLFTSEPTTRPRRHRDCLVIGRHTPRAEDDPAELARMARGEGWFPHLVKRKVKTTLKRAASPAYRRYVARTTSSPSLS
jgi:peptidoglycan/xylan/chitin deacetylase (PgdA/CDA1 family)